MKKIHFFALLFSIFISCKSKEVEIIIDVDPSLVIGKWVSTNIVKYKNNDGSWKNWEQIDDSSALSIYEFKNEGSFIRDGKPGGDCCCCSGGDRYSISKNVISFTSTLGKCVAMDCGEPFCDRWKIEKIDVDTLILNECFVKNKYVRKK
jgi:hypothetical protein